MWNPFRRNKKDQDIPRVKNDRDVSCVALHELPTGDIRAVAYTTNGSQIQTLEYIGTLAGARQHMSKEYEYIVRHVPDGYYAYGVAFAPAPEESVLYEDMHSKGYSSHTLLRCVSVDECYHCWSALETDQLISAHKHKSNQSIGSGFAGLSRLFGFDDSVVFLFVSVERTATTIALLRGQSVLHQTVLPVGTSTLIRTVADTLVCPTDMARRIVEGHGVMDTHYDPRLRNRIIATLLPVQESIRATVRSYMSQPYKPAYARTPISSWVMSGVGAQIPGLAGLLGLASDLEQHDDIVPEYQRLLVELPVGPHRSSLPRYHTVLGLAISGD